MEFGRLSITFPTHLSYLCTAQIVLKLQGWDLPPQTIFRGSRSRRRSVVSWISVTRNVARCHWMRLLVGGLRGKMTSWHEAIKVHCFEKTLNSYIYIWYHYVTICHYACHENSYTCTYIYIDTVFQSAENSPCLFSISLCLVHFPSPRIRVLDDKTLEFFGGFFFFHPWKVGCKEVGWMWSCWVFYRYNFVQKKSLNPSLTSSRSSCWLISSGFLGGEKNTG